MWTPREVQDRLRRELDFDRLVVKLLPKARPDDLDMPGRFAVCVRVRRLTGRRSWPVTLLDDGTVYHGGDTTLREACDDDQIVYVHEDAAGRFLSLDPTLMRRELERRDSHHVDLPGELKAAIAKKRKTLNDQHNDEVRERTRYYRKAFARFARGEETGL